MKNRNRKIPNQLFFPHRINLLWLLWAVELGIITGNQSHIFG